jgi:hypothetical protein
MVERFVLTTGTISIANGASTVVGTGTLWGGADLEGGEVWVFPTNAAPFYVGTIAAISPSFSQGGRYDNLALPLLHPWNGTGVVNQPYEVKFGLGMASNATPAAIFARFVAFLQQNGGLVFNKADALDYSLIPVNSLFVDSVTRTLYQWRAGVLEPVYAVGSAFNPRGLWDIGTTYAKGDLVQQGTAAFISNFDGNVGNAPTTSPAPTSDANWTMLFIGSGADYADLVVSIPGVIASSEHLAVVAFARTTVFPAGLSGSIAKARVAATGSTVLSLLKNGIQFGTVTFAASGTTGTFAAASDTTFTAGDVLSIIGQASADATLADVSVTLLGTTDVASSPTQSGLAVVDFGAPPGSFDTSVVITGQGKITANSLVHAWLLPGSGTADHTADEHLLSGLRLMVANIVAGTGFTIQAYSPDGATHGQYNIAWRWT